MVTRQQVIDTARTYLSVKYSHQGRNRHALDCGGLILVVGRELGLTELEELGYASFPGEGRFEKLLEDNTDSLNYSSRYPHKFSGEEFKPSDILAFDYDNGEGVRHSAFVSKFEAGRYWIIHAIPIYGVTEHPLAHPFSRAIITAYSIRGLAD